MSDAVTTCLIKLKERLGIDRFFLAAQNDSDFANLLTAMPDRAAALALINPNRFTLPALTLLQERLTLFTGSDGVPADAVAKAMPELPGAVLVKQDNYPTTAWSDVVADHSAAILTALEQQFSPHFSTVTALNLPAQSGDIDGLHYQVSGQGPALFLFPLLLAAQQWQPILPRLQSHYTVIQLSGPLLGMVAVLEARGREPGYVRAVKALLDDLELKPNGRLLDIGCGTGVLDRMIARTTNGQVAIEATDVNPFLLVEARALTATSGVEQAIHYVEGNAENLPYDAAQFDGVLSCTVMEECHADRMLREMIRVCKPGGRIGVLVRATDLPGICNAVLPESIRQKMQQPYPSVGADGCADASLYARFAAAGLESTRFFPFLAAVSDANSAMLKYREAYYRTLLTEDEQHVWERAKAKAIDDGSFFMAFGLHCASGSKP